jgi:hypothetical protein
MATVNIPVGDIDGATSESVVVGEEGVDQHAADQRNQPVAESAGEQAVTVFSLASPFHDSLQADNRTIPIFGRQVHMKQSWAVGGKGGTDIGFGE